MPPRGKKRTRSVAALEADNSLAKAVKGEENDVQNEPQPEASGSGDKDARIRELEAKILELSQLAPSRDASAHVEAPAPVVTFEGQSIRERATEIQKWIDLVNRKCGQGYHRKVLAIALMLPHISAIKELAYRPSGTMPAFRLIAGLVKDRISDCKFQRNNDSQTAGDNGEGSGPEHSSEFDDDAAETMYEIAKKLREENFQPLDMEEYSYLNGVRDTVYGKPAAFLYSWTLGPDCVRDASKELRKSIARHYRLAVPTDLTQARKRLKQIQYNSYMIPSGAQLAFDDTLFFARHTYTINPAKGDRLSLDKLLDGFLVTIIKQGYPSRGEFDPQKHLEPLRDEIKYLELFGIQSYMTKSYKLLSMFTDARQYRAQLLARLDQEISLVISAYKRNQNDGKSMSENMIDLQLRYFLEDVEVLSNMPHGLIESLKTVLYMGRLSLAKESHEIWDRGYAILFNRGLHHTLDQTAYRILLRLKEQDSKLILVDQLNMIKEDRAFVRSKDRALKYLPTSYEFLKQWLESPN